MNSGEEISSVVRFTAHDVLQATNRMTSGEGYKGLRDSLERLHGTSISTNIKTGGEEKFELFNLVEYAKIVRKSRNGRMQEIEIKLSDWVFNAITHKEVLTLHPQYFRLRKPLERRMYELARKHCGAKDEWRISIALLKMKSGSGSTLKELKRLVSHIVAQDRQHSHIPDYAVTLEGDFVVFTNRHTMNRQKTQPSPAAIRLADDTYHDARGVAPGWDIYVLEQEWREWITEPPRDPDAAFIGFCRKWFEKRGAP